MHERATPEQGPDHAGQPALPESCSYCRRPLAAEESAIVLMRDGRPVAAYHDRCHPHHRRSGCSAC